MSYEIIDNLVDGGEEMFVEKKKYLLSIYIPTYNRSREVCRQVKFFINEMKECMDIVELVVSNNASTDDTEDRLLNLFSGKRKFKYYCNSKNIGIIGNGYKALERTNGKYVWTVGDDDVFEKGVLERILSILNNNHNLNFLFLNHDAIYGRSLEKARCYDGEFGLIDNTWEMVKQNFYSRSSSMMFTSCIIHSREILQTVVDIIPLDNYLGYGFSYIAALIAIKKGHGFFEKKIYVHDQVRRVSWNGQRIESFNGCYNSLLMLQKAFYSKEEVIWMQKKYIEDAPTIDIIIEEMISGEKYWKMSLKLLLKMFLRNPKVIIRKIII